MKVGIDIGGTNTKLVVYDGNAFTQRLSLPTTNPNDKGFFIQKLACQIAMLCKDSCVEHLAVAVAGVVDGQRGVVVHAPNLNWREFDMVCALKSTGVFSAKSISILNDADAAALGEALWGAGMGFKSSILLTLGTGLGAGVVVDGKLIEGCEGGHMLFEKDGISCACGAKGCFEQYASATALSRLIEQKGADFTNISVFEQCSKNPIAAKIVEEYSLNLAMGIASLYNLLHPEAIILGGGVSLSFKHFAPYIESYCRQNVIGGFKAKLLPSALGTFAGAMGAANYR